MNKINVTRTFLPPMEEYTRILQRAWDKYWITNNGELVQELEEKLRALIGSPYVLFTNNGTVVLQMAIKALGITGEVITTPFSYVATTNALLWEGCTPVFADIREGDYCIDPSCIESLITPRTTAILATHVYGLPCDTEALEQIAQKHRLKVIYDGAHAFGATYRGKSLLQYGDITTCSFHATKLFHTVEGGCIIARDEETFKALRLMRSFGHVGDDYFSVGVNGKNSEFHAAMGLAVWPYIPELIERRKALTLAYKEALQGLAIRYPEIDKDLSYNYSYFPLFFESEQMTLKVKSHLEAHDIFTRRYFYPSLNTLPFVENKQRCPVSEKAAVTALCLPLYPDLSMEDLHRITTYVREAMEK